MTSPETGTAQIYAFTRQQRGCRKGFTTPSLHVQYCMTGRRETRNRGTASRSFNKREVTKTVWSKNKTGSKQIKRVLYCTKPHLASLREGLIVALHPEITPSDVEWNRLFLFPCGCVQHDQGFRLPGLRQTRLPKVQRRLFRGLARWDHCDLDAQRNSCTHHPVRRVGTFSWYDGRKKNAATLSWQFGKRKYGKGSERERAVCTHNGKGNLSSLDCCELNAMEHGLERGEKGQRQKQANTTGAQAGLNHQQRMLPRFRSEFSTSCCRGYPCSNGKEQ